MNLDDRIGNSVSQKREASVRQLTQTIVITGASRGLGEALALLYAAPGRTLGLLGRHGERLEIASSRCRHRGARVVSGTPDVTDHPALAHWIRCFDEAHPIDLLIVNAGIFTGHGKTAPETVDEAISTFRTNLEGAVLTIAAALPMMRGRRAGRIAIIGSQAVLHPLADAPAYSASKAGLMSYGEALREWLVPDNVSVSLIYPGHIRTAQVAHHVGPLPLIMSVDKAARIIKRGLDRGRSRIIFPQRLHWLIRAGRLLPWRLRAQIGSASRFYVSRPSDEG